MLNWLNAYGDAASALLNAVMVAIWFAYLQIFLGHYRRQTRARILINQSHGQGRRSHCVVANMGGEPIYLHTVICSVEEGEGSYSSAICDNQDPADLGLSDIAREGPIHPGGILDIGSFDDLLRSLGWDGFAPGTGDPPFGRLRVRVVAVHGPDDLMIGASRHFRLVPGRDSVRIAPETADTEQIRSRRGRRQLVDLLIRHRT